MNIETGTQASPSPLTFNVSKAKESLSSERSNGHHTQSLNSENAHVYGGTLRGAQSLLCIAASANGAHILKGHQLLGENKQLNSEHAHRLSSAGETTGAAPTQAG
ncbi:hypothetical protein NDU88_001761 [Pleurodeles waltl]|uniref:Uncharacterized protein n=1 Tax=Pleurodeles waltl TaxID=8319 RepID=A0AAV7WQC6_PLEWA|nr:hypothetical protein NDU88_001761 [Pleurodeles waltl]